MRVWACVYTYLSDRRMSTRRISPFHLPDGRLNPACIPKQNPVWCVSWGPEIVVHRDFGPSICMICKHEFTALHLCFGGFCHHKRICTGCSIPQERIACSNCWCKCKSSCKCTAFAQRVIRVYCIRCWEVLLMYEDQLGTSAWGHLSRNTLERLRRRGRVEQGKMQIDPRTTADGKGHDKNISRRDNVLSSNSGTAKNPIARKKPKTSAALLDQCMSSSSDSENDTVPFPRWVRKRKRTANH